MSIYKKIEANEARIEAGESLPIARQIDLYSKGLIAKLKNAEYALFKIIEFSTQIDSSTLTSQFTFLDMVHFYLDSFFAFSYTSFDVIAQVINLKCNLNTPETKVSFRKIKEKVNQANPGAAIQILINRICNSNFFKDMEKYRNCSTHRRQICIQSNKTETLLTPGYIATIPMPIISHILCDDPLMLNPKFTKNREMITYCNGCFIKTQDEIIKILKKL